MIYDDAFCPECGGGVNDYGFCADCGCDFDEYMNEKQKEWEYLTRE